MKAVILVGGKATRLLPLTCNRPKAMMPVLNRPFLEYVFRHLTAHGVTDIVLAQGYLAESLQSYLGDGARFGARLYYSNEDSPLGTAGAVKNAERYLDGHFLVLNGDIVTTLDIKAMVDFHSKRKAKLTIALTPVEDPTAYGLVETDAQGRISRFLEKPKPNEITTNLINAGTYIVEQEVLSQIAPGRAVSFEREVFPNLVTRKEPVYAYPSSAYWIDMGTPEKYLQLNRDLLTGKCPAYLTDKNSAIDKSADIHPTAEIKGPVVIGISCNIGRTVKIIGPTVIGNGCTIQDDSLVDSSVLWQNIRLDTEVKVANSIIGDNCRLESGSICENAVLGDNVTVKAGCKVEPASKIYPGETVGA
ncbi:MAG: NDP-sugar synthase [Chloroflexota bacterium]